VRNADEVVNLSSSLKMPRAAVRGHPAAALAATLFFAAAAARPAAGARPLFPQLLGTWLPTYGDADTNALVNETAAAAALSALAAAGANTVYVDAWHAGATTFPSATWEAAAGAAWAGTDYLSYPVSLAKARGLRVVAWFEYGLAYAGALQVAQPSWGLGDANGFSWMNASDARVRDFIVGITLDALRHAPALDGVQFDDHFAWPAALPGPAPAARRAALTTLAARLRAAVAAAAPAAAVSLAPNPADTAFADSNVDWPAWLAAGLVDDAVVQLYCYDADYFAARLQQQVDALPGDAAARARLARRLAAGVLLNNGPQSNANATAMMRAELAAAANASAPVGGQVLWYARGILEYQYDAVKAVWATAGAAAGEGAGVAAAGAGAGGDA